MSVYYFINVMKKKPDLNQVHEVEGTADAEKRKKNSCYRQLEFLLVYIAICLTKDQILDCAVQQSLALSFGIFRIE